MAAAAAASSAVRKRTSSSWTTAPIDPLLPECSIVKLSDETWLVKPPRLRERGTLPSSTPLSENLPTSVVPSRTTSESAGPAVSRLIVKPSAAASEGT